MSGERKSDRALLDAFARRRDEASFRELYRRHSPMLYALALRLCGAGAEAEELVQEAWVRAVERHDRFAGRSRYSTWLTGILINCHREAARRGARSTRASAAQTERAAVVAMMPHSQRLPADPMDVERALTALPEGYREVLILHDLNGYTHAEIATMLGIHEGSSKSQLARARARLRALLATDTSGERTERGSS